VQPQQEVKQSGTSIHKQAPAFYWITSWQKKNHFTLETGNASHSFICAFRIACMLTPSAVSYNREFFLPKSKIHSMWTWMKILQMHRDCTVLLTGRLTMSTEMTLDSGQWHWKQKVWLKGR
jgi:hypothetical protein